MINMIDFLCKEGYILDGDDESVFDIEKDKIYKGTIDKNCA